jgi:hypothetical protein
MVKENDKLIKEGKLKIQNAKPKPMQAAKMHRVPFNQQELEQVHPSFAEMKRPGIVIGSKSLASEGKWRC